MNNNKKALLLWSYNLTESSFFPTKIHKIMPIIMQNFGNKRKKQTKEKRNVTLNK